MQAVVCHPPLPPVRGYCLDQTRRPTLFAQEIRPNPRSLMTRWPLQCRTSIIRPSTLVQASSNLSMVHTRTWPRTASSSKFYFRHGFRGLLFKFDQTHKSISQILIQESNLFDIKSKKSEVDLRIKLFMLYICIYIYLYSNTHICIHIHIHIYIHIYICIYIYLYISRCRHRQQLSILFYQ